MFLRVPPFSFLSFFISTICCRFGTVTGGQNVVLFDLFWILDLVAIDSGPVIMNLMTAFKILDLIGISAFTLTDLLKTTPIWRGKGCKKEGRSLLVMDWFLEF